MNTKHIIAQCSWQSTFDQENNAHELQNFISQWSNTVLTEELDLCFNDLCPDTQTWRINAMHLDLGDVLFDDLLHELPKRLRASLRATFARMLTHQQLSIVSNDSDNLQILDHIESLHEFVSWFLQNGAAPWWFSGVESALQILDRQLDQDASTTIELIRDLGRSEIVRQRLVWQLGEARIQRIIHLLEPWQGDFICSFAENVFVVQEQRNLLPTAVSEFRKTIWLTILTYLLVDRGTLFNTVAFVRANLRRTAQHYQIDYQKLLGHMFQAVLALEPLGLIANNFFSAIKIVNLQDHGSVETPRAEIEAAPDPWLALQKMLHYSLKRHTIGSDILQSDELFTALAHQDAKRMATLLLLEGKSHSARQGLLKHFSSTELALVVHILEPQNHLFIVAYVQQTQTQVELQHWEKKTVWQVLLAYLFTERGSYFDRRQLIHETLLNLCKLHRFDFSLFLDLLIHTVQFEHPNHHRFELLAIFQDLRSKQALQHPASEVQHSYLQATLQYLKTGANNDRSAIQAMPQQLMFKSLISGSGEQSLTLLLRATDIHTTTDAVLSLRLLKLVGAADLPLLLNLLEPNATRFCVSLISSLLQWQQQEDLPSLAGVDLAFQLPVMLIQALPGFYQSRRGSSSTFNLAAFWHSFSILLQQQGGVNIPAFYQQLAYCLGQDEQIPSVDGRPIQRPVACHGAMQNLSPLLQLIQTNEKSGELLSSASTSQQALLLPKLVPTEVPCTPEAKQWSLTQLFQALRLRLMPEESHSSETLPQALEALPITTLWYLLEQSGNYAISDWLERQPDKYYLLKRLSHERHIQPIERWLLTQLPAELNPPEETLKHWSALLQEGGYWQGASAVLEQQLNEVFWAVSFDAKAQNLPTSELLARMATSACLRLNISLSDCLASFKNQTQFLQKKHWHNAYKVMLKHSPQLAEEGDHPFQELVKTIPSDEHLARTTAPVDFQQDYLAKYLSHPRFISIARCLLQQGRSPSWVRSGQTIDLSRLLFDVFTIRPDLLPRLLDNLQQAHAVMFRLLNIVPFAWLLDAMCAITPNNQSSVISLGHFQQCLEQIFIPNSSKQQRTAILFQFVLKHWLKHDWTALVPDKLVSSFLYQLMCQQHLSKKTLQKAFAPHMEKLPEILRLALAKVLSNAIDSAPENTPKTDQMMSAMPPDKKLTDAIKAVQKPQVSATPMHINNAGLVILQGFITTFFHRLSLIENNQFVTLSAQRRAVHYLQYLVTGSSETPEQYLILNKLLCGLALHEPVEIGIEISKVEEEICLSLLNSVIDYWDAIGSSSIEGFRGNWLVRDGTLTDANDHWDLIVDRRAYDLLLARIPFSYSVIKHPWMEKAIYVTWPT